MVKDNHIYYTYCDENAARAVHVARMLSENQFINADDIRQQRQQDMVARRQVWEELHRLFLPPMDREDLWSLCCVTASVAESASGIVLEADRQGRSSLAGEYQSITQALLKCCLAVREAITALPDFRRSDTALKHIADIQARSAAVERTYSLAVKALWKSSAVTGPLRLCDGMIKTARQCQQVGDYLLFVLLKNS